MCACTAHVRVAEQNRVGRVSGKRCNARGTHNVPLCSAAESGHVSEGELLASGMVRGPVLRLNGGVFEAQHAAILMAAAVTTYVLCLLTASQW